MSSKKAVKCKQFVVIVITIVFFKKCATMSTIEPLCGLETADYKTQQTVDTQLLQFRHNEQYKW